MYWSPESRWVILRAGSSILSKKNPLVLFFEEGHAWEGEEQTARAEIKVLTVQSASQEFLDVIHGWVRPLYKTLELNNGLWSSAGCLIFFFFVRFFPFLFFPPNLFSYFNTMLVFFIVNTRNCACTLHQQNILVNIFWHSEVICVKYWVSAFHSAGKSREMAGHWRGIDSWRMSLELHYQAWHQVCLNPSFHILWRGERERWVLSNHQVFKAPTSDGGSARA